MVQIFEVSARSKAAITSVLADEEMVVFGTDAGNLVAMMADAPRKLWQFDAARAMAGPVIRDGDSYFFANKDTNVYRVDAAGSGGATLGWKYQTEAVLDRPPRVTAAVVYQYALGRGLTAIDKQSGKALWFLAEGVDLLAEIRGRAYIITKYNSLASWPRSAAGLTSSRNIIRWLSWTIAAASNCVKSTSPP
jgi:outer membrane protein assembly factor BamB